MEKERSGCQINKCFLNHIDAFYAHFDVLKLCCCSVRSLQFSILISMYCLSDKYWNQILIIAVIWSVKASRVNRIGYTNRTGQVAVVK